MMDNIRNRRRLMFVKTLCVMLCVLLAYKWQRTFFNVCTGGIYSDVPLHIQLALGRNDYGLSSYIIRALYAIGDEHFAQTALSLILAANHVAGIFTLCALVCCVLPEINRWYAFLACELALLCGPWLIPGYQMGVYIGAHNGNLYHNMTVLFSRTFVPLCFVFFFRIRDNRHGKIALSDWLIFTALFLVATLFKPNFAFAFIPMLAVMLVWDFVKYRGRYLKNEIITGLSVVPAGLSCIWSYLVLFADDFAGTKSELALGIYMGMSLTALAVMFIRGLLLPIYTFTVQGRKEKNARYIGLIALCDLIAILEASFIVETGYRATDGNLDWGSLAIYPSMFAIGIALLFRMLQNTDKSKPGDIAKAAVGIIMLLGHLAVGVYFYHAFNSGLSYFV